MHPSALTRRALLLTLASPALAPRPAWSQPAALTALRDLARRQGIAQASFAVLQGGRVQRTGLLAGRPGDAESAVFQAASLSKPVVAYAALRLVQQRRLVLDAPVARFLPKGYTHRGNPLALGETAITDWVAPERLQGLTLRQLLNHSSGLPAWSAGPWALDFEPGRRWQYSGEGYTLVQRLIETVSGQPLDAFLARELFEPLGMASSSFVWRDALAARVAAGRTADGSPRQLRFNEPLAGASLYTTAPDYARFMAALHADAEALRLTLADPITASTEPPLHWGLGWGLEQASTGPVLWQWGNNPGYRALAMLAPATGDGFVLLSASERGLVLATPLAQWLLPGEHPALRSPLLG